MNLLEKLAFELMKASNEKNVQKCIEIGKEIAKVLETYKTCC